MFQPFRSQWARQQPGADSGADSQQKRRDDPVDQRRGEISVQQFFHIRMTSL